MREPCRLEEALTCRSLKAEGVSPALDTLLGDPLFAAADREDQWRFHADASCEGRTGQLTLGQELT